MYTPIERGTIAQRTRSYIPISEGVISQPKPENYKDIFGLEVPSFKVAQSTQETLIGESGKTPQAIVGNVAKDFGQIIARSIGSAALTIARNTPKLTTKGMEVDVNENVGTLKAEDFSKYLGGKTFFETIS